MTLGLMTLLAAGFAHCLGYFGGPRSWPRFLREALKDAYTGRHRSMVGAS